MNVSQDNTASVIEGAFSCLQSFFNYDDRGSMVHSRCLPPFLSFFSLLVHFDGQMRLLMGMLSGCVGSVKSRNR